jgi:hypothetical protein
LEPFRTVRGKSVSAARVTKDDVIRLVEAGVPDETILRNIRACGVTAILERPTASSAKPRRVARLARGGRAASISCRRNRWIAAIDGRAMVWVPPGQFQMGSGRTNRTARKTR